MRREHIAFGFVNQRLIRRVHRRGKRFERVIKFFLLNIHIRQILHRGSLKNGRFIVCQHPLIRLCRIVQLARLEQRCRCLQARLRGCRVFGELLLQRRQFRRIAFHLRRQLRRLRAALVHAPLIRHIAHIAQRARHQQSRHPFAAAVPNMLRRVNAFLFVVITRHYCVLH